MLSKTTMNSHVYGEYNGVLRYVETHSGYNEKCVPYRDILPHIHIHSLGLKWKMSHTQSWHGCPVLHSTWLISLFHLLWFMVSDDRPLGCYRWTECLSNPSKWQTHPHSTSLSNKTQLTVLIKEHKPWNHMSAHMHTAYRYEMTAMIYWEDAIAGLLLSLNST